MSMMRNFAVAAGVALASTGAFADEATENAMLCMSMKDQEGFYSLPAGKEKETCSCVGKHSAMMQRSEPQLSNADVMHKGYHACLSGGSISEYYSSFAYRAVVGQVGESTANQYASCMKTQGLIEGMRFTTDSRTRSSMVKAASNSCQYILNIKV